jgi:glycosyltransferase involved in cell wall biosynthesis
MNISELHIFALAAHGDGISGGDRIFIELARRWRKEFPIIIHTWDEGERMCKRQELNEDNNLRFKIYELGILKSLGFKAIYLARIFIGVKIGFTLSLENKREVVMYNASEFWMDSLPCFLLKLRFPKTTWVATWYQTAPNPVRGFAEGARENKYTISALFYWLAQLPIKPLISNFSDKVIVNNEDERKRFPKHSQKNIFVMIGAVPLQSIKQYIKNNKKVNKKYDAVFQGRFHPQKGVVELVEIWSKVLDEKPNAMLAMIGDGPLMKDVREKIRKLKLEDNIRLFGYVFDGDKKYRIFSQSKMVVHPAFYDSGGMASAEAMAFSLPAVGFDLVAYKSYYPKGMVKVPINNMEKFSDAVVELLANDKKREKIGKEAFGMIAKSWSWETRAAEAFQWMKS